MLFFKRWRQHIERRLTLNEQATADLQAALTRVQASAAATAAEVRKLAGEVTAGHDADDSEKVEDAVAKLNAVADALDASVAGAETPPTPTPAPEPTPAPAA